MTEFGVRTIRGESFGAAVRKTDRVYSMGGHLCPGTITVTKQGGMANLYTYYEMSKADKASVSIKLQREEAAKLVAALQELFDL